jgi:hypothetical protein
MLRIQHCLYSRLTDGVEVGSRMRRPTLYSTETFVFLLLVFIYIRFSVELLGLVMKEGLGKFTKIIPFNWSRNENIKEEYFRGLVFSAKSVQGLVSGVKCCMV